MSLRDIINWILDVNLLKVFGIIVAVVIVVWIITWLIMGTGVILGKFGEFLNKVGDEYDKFNKPKKIFFWIFVFVFFYIIYSLLKSQS